MPDINTPVGRLVQGALKMQQRKDMRTKQALFNKDGTPNMGTFFSVAYPKVLPNGQQNTEFATFYQQLAQVAAAAWPQFFPQGATGACTNPKFSWKIQDGDGVDSNGQSVADKPGFKGHWIVKFDTDYPLRCFHEGKFAPHEEIQNAAEVIKRGYWIRVFGEAKSNNADLSAQQVPGISIYPKLVSFVERGEEIVSGPDAQAAFGGGVTGWRPPVTNSAIPLPGAPAGLPVPGVAAGLPVPGTAGGIPLPGQPAPLPTPVTPNYVVRPDLAAQGHTMQTLAAHGTPEQLLAAGYITIAPAPAAPVGLPTLPTPGALPTVGIPLPSAAAPVAGPRFELIPALKQQGVTMEGLIAQGWTAEALVQAGHAVKIG